MKYKSIIVFFLLFVANFNIQAQNDSINFTETSSNPRFWKKAIVPVSLIGLGLLVQQDHGFYSSFDAREDIRQHFPDFHTSIDDYLPFVPLAAFYALDFYGIKGEKSLIEFSKIMFITQALNMGLVYTIKEISNVERPDASANNSMPSGHTAFAFASATLFYKQFKDKGWLYRVSPFVVAGTTGFLRMMNNRHWLSDVLVGAGIGILTTECVWNFYPKIFPKKEYRNSQLVFVPSFQNKIVSVSFLLSF